MNELSDLTTPLLLFCEDPLNRRQPDEVYRAEVEAATAQDFPYALINFEALVYENDPARAVRRVPGAESDRSAIYRGWMLRPMQYKALYDSLSTNGVRLINDPAAYLHCHYLPESYSAIEGRTPHSVWLRLNTDIDFDEIMTLLQPFGSKPLILKDYVKSQKHYWEEACFIPSASDREAVMRVVKRFVDLQGADLNEGLVFREFVEFEPLTVHSKSGMPLTLEFRVFILDGAPLLVTEYWEEGDYQGMRPAFDQFNDVVSRVGSRFFTMDIAKRKDEEWMIVELGDAQVAGLPETVNVRQFYKALRDRLDAI